MDKKQEFNFDDNFTINNDQGLEEEELKDRIRREEEIHDLLTRAMGHCSLTDDSSINSSSHTAIETTTDPPLLSTNDPEKQYLESNIDEQLKVLYEIRCREVVELTEQLQKNRAELKEREGVSKTKLALLELENERKNISLQEAQNLLVDKTDQAKELNKQLDNIKYMVTCLEGNLAEVNEEKEVLRQLNLSLEQQMHLMEKNGFSLMNKSSDRELREQLNNKIQQLEQSLQSALKQNELREKQHSELIRELQQNLQEKDDRLAEKGFLINKLTENFEAAQSQCHELLKTVSELRDAEKIDSDSKDLTKHSPLNEELLKIRENKERFEMCENVRKAVTDEFQAHINSLTSMNQILNEKILAQEKRLGEALRNGEIISTIEKEKEILQGNVDDLENKLRYTTRENEKYQKQLAVLADANSKNADISLQTSFAHINISDFENIHKENKKLSSELESALAFIHKLEAKFSQLHEENSHLKIKIGLEQERDTLIQELKEKAIICEKLIKEKQENYRTEQINVISVGINTEQYDEVNNSLLKLQYDTLLYQREADLRNALQREFDSKHETLLSRYKEQFSKLAACQECESLKADVKQMSEDRKEDRMAVLNFVGTWQSKINEVGINSDQRYKECLALMDKEYTEKFKTLADMIQEQFLKERKQEEHNMYQSRTRLNNRISDSINKIVSKIQQGDNEVKADMNSRTKKIFANLPPAIDNNNTFKCSTDKKGTENNYNNIHKDLLSEDNIYKLLLAYENFPAINMLTETTTSYGVVQDLDLDMLKKYLSEGEKLPDLFCHELMPELPCHIALDNNATSIDATSESENTALTVKHSLKEHPGLDYDSDDSIKDPPYEQSNSNYDTSDSSDITDIEKSKRDGRNKRNINGMMDESQNNVYDQDRTGNKNVVHNSYNNREDNNNSGYRNSIEEKIVTEEKGEHRYIEEVESGNNVEVGNNGEGSGNDGEENNARNLLTKGGEPRKRKRYTNSLSKRKQIKNQRQTLCKTRM